MKKTAFVLVLLALAGCRREDMREYTLSIPEMREADKSRIAAALARYDGVDKNSYSFDFANKTLSLRYDSMKLAKTNIRMAIGEIGLAAKDQR